MSEKIMSAREIAKKIRQKICDAVFVGLVSSDKIGEVEEKIIIDALTAQAKLYEGQIASLSRQLSKFKHMHVAGTTKGLDIDTCAKCGLDLREEIHNV